VRTDRSFQSSRSRKAIVWLVALKCAALLVVIDPASLSAFDLPKSTISRGLAYVLVALLLIATVRYGTRIWPTAGALVPVASFVGVAAAATISSPEPSLALFGDYERFEGLSFLLDMTTLSAAVAVGFRAATDWARLGAALAGASLLVLFYAVIQRFGLDPMRWTLQPMDRPFSTLGHPDMLGHFLAVGFGVSLGVALFPHPRVVGLLRRTGTAFVLAFAAVAGIVATRGSIVGFGAALAAVTITVAYRRPRASVRRVLAALLVLVVAAGLLAASPLADRARATVEDRLDLATRVAVYQSALGAIEQRPWLGYGPDTFSAAYPRGRDPSSTVILQRQPLSSAHSWVLQTLVSFGVVGLTALLALLVLTSRILLTTGMTTNPWLSAPLLVGFAAYWGAGFFGVQSVGVDWFPWVAFGAAATMSPAPIELPEIRRFRGGILLILISLGAAASTLLALTAGEEAWQSRLLALRQSELAAEHALRAVALDPGRGEYWYWLGQSEEVASDWKSAGDAYAQAAARQTYNSVFWISLGRARARQALAGDASSGGQGSAITALRRAIEADPYDPDAHAALADVATQFGDGDTAVPAAVRAVELYPPDNAYDRLVLKAARAASDPRAGAAHVDRALLVKDSPPLRVAAGELALRLGDMPTARAHATRASQLAPNDGDVRALLAKLPKA
jgi:O-antigen ligase/tetratricopeptide (TPR) repeat protein